MGYNATVVVLLDRLDEIERDPAFGKKLADAIRHRAGNHHERKFITGQTEVVEVHHASHLAIVAVGGNTGRVIGWTGRALDDDAIVRDLERERRRKKREAHAKALEMEAAE